ncbi:MAG: hypothetical protein OJF59_000047 [Cytophagales bacterium]|jgi:polysaccharide export outer membrane protein|nr:polysaccharide biosynthesis/export family protein [Bacteroidota bacterium]MBS1982437.1 polysaccharide biosynthesis/export family protein [Bacteroidota bacterium]WHZ06295.1 MAG: hypothetical protein OJF59_000047 [Cytophagales bacterium]
MYKAILLSGISLLSACSSYKKNIMFKPTEGNPVEVFERQAQATQKDYIIQKNDLLKLAVYSNKGERFIDPNPDLSNTGKAAPSANASNEVISYLVDQSGIVKLPLIGELKLEGLTLRQAEEIAQKEYSKYFTDSFVQFTFVNKRVIVLGAPGGHVIPLTNQSMTVAEVLALSKGVANDARADKIKLIRNNHVYSIDFSTIQGFQQGNLIVEAGDIVYVEPIRRPFSEGLRDNYFIGSLLLSLISLIFIYRVK